MRKSLARGVGFLLAQGRGVSIARPGELSRIGVWSVSEPQQTCIEGPPRVSLALQTPLTAAHCNTLQHTETHCNTPHHTATRCNIETRLTARTLTHCSTLQHRDTRHSRYPNTLQHNAIRHASQQVPYARQMSPQIPHKNADTLL